MPADTADIIGTKGSKFTFTLDSATIRSASLERPDHTTVSLAISGNKREVTVGDPGLPDGLPAGDSVVTLGLIWAPGDPDATIDVGKVTSGTATAASPKSTIDAGDIPGFVQLFGE